MNRRAAVLAVAVALAGPWTTGIQGWARTPADGVLTSPLMFTLAGILALGCLWVLERDRWLGILGLFLVARAALTLGPPMLESCLYLVGGMVILTIVRNAECGMRNWAGRLIVVAGGLQAGYAVLQWIGYHPLAVGTLPVVWQPDGTLGNSNYLGAYLAATIAFAPWWAVPLWAVGLGLSKSAAGGIAAAAALIVRALGGADRTYWTHGTYGVGAALAVMAGVLWARGLDATSWGLRVATWRALLQAMHGPALWLGYGPGAWAILGPRLHGAAGEIAREPWLWAHSDALQLLFEGGVIAVAIAAWWASGVLGRMGRMGPGERGAVTALGVLTVLSFPWHMPAVGPTAAVALGIAMSAGQPCPPGSRGAPGAEGTDGTSR